MKVGIVSGYFNSPHLGHIRYINAAKELCDSLIVIVNNDHQVKLKGRNPLMLQLDRVEFMKNIKAVDLSILASDDDSTVCKTLKYIKQMFKNHELTFYNSGDRKPSDPNNPSPETLVCKELGINKVFLDLPKIYSSSDILKARP